MSEGAGVSEVLLGEPLAVSRARGLDVEGFGVAAVLGLREIVTVVDFTVGEAGADALAEPEAIGVLLS